MAVRIFYTSQRENCKTGRDFYNKKGIIVIPTGIVAEATGNLEIRRGISVLATAKIKIAISKQPIQNNGLSKIFGQPFVHLQELSFSSGSSSIVAYFRITNLTSQ